jgi:aspartyl-tRNA(Asn)/glutamyl-tRNA(Gln) amidotransferase subunit A
MIEELAAGVRAGEIDPVELTEQALARAAEHAGLNAVVHLDVEGARAAAARAHTGPLAGIPLLVKEIIAVEGLPLRCGSKVFAGRVASEDAEIVQLVRAAGAVIIGLSHTHEFAYGCTGASNVAGPCRNPHDPSRITGGSSSGSAAAVGAGIVPLALGTDTAGSVRIPAALCGVVGALPSRSALPAGGVFPLSTTLDRVGLLTTSVADARYALESLTGISLPAAGPPPRLGVLPWEADPEVTSVYRPALDALAGAGAALVEVTAPNWTALAEVAFDLQGPEAAAIHREIGAPMEDYQADVQQRLRTAAEVPGWRYVRARNRMPALTEELGALLSTVDALVLPTLPIVAPPIDGDHAEVRDLLLRNNRPLNVTGFPAFSLPLWPSGGLPAGLQLIASDDAAVFAAADWVERVLTTA